MDEQAYANIKAHLNIDTARLTEELVELPQYQQEASEGAAEAQRIRDDAKDALEIAKADASAAIRYETTEGRPPSEERIKSEILLNETVQNAMGILREAEYDLTIWKALADGMRTKSYAIGKIGDLISAGYTTPTTIFANRRTQINAERQRLRGT